jgi:DnaJ domain
MIGTDDLLLDPKGYYQVLGVAPDASTDEIRRAYRNVARRWHPDLNPSDGAAEKMKAINEAFEVLGDESARADYDEHARLLSSASLWASPSTGRFAQQATGEFSPLVFTIHSDGPVTAVDISANRGTWWSADVEYVSNAGHLLTITVHARPTIPGPYHDVIVISTDGSTTQIGFAAVVLAGTSRPDSSSAPRIAHPADPDAWSSRLRTFVRVGVAGFLTAWFWTPYLIDHLARFSSVPLSSASTPLLLVATSLLLVLGAKTRWFRSGAGVRNVFATLTAIVGWCLLAATVAVVAIVVVLIAACIAFIALIAKLFG